jgi:hypothetical protein
VIGMHPRAAEVLRERMPGGSSGSRDPRSIAVARHSPFLTFGGKAPVRPGRHAAGREVVPGGPCGPQS